MSAANAKPSINAGRRIRWLAFGTVVAVAVYCGGWFWLAGQVDRAVADYTDAPGAQLASIACDGRQVRGFPFRLGVFCDRVAYADPEAGLTVELGAIRSAAQIYNPRRVLVEIDSPVTIAETAGGDQYRLDWQRGRASVITAPVAERMASFEAEDATLALNGSAPLVRAARLETHVRERDGALDVAARPRGLTVDPALAGGRSLPELGVDLDVRLQDWRRDWATGAPAGAGVVNRLSLLLTDDRGIIVEGPFSLSRRGLISGEFEVRVIDVPGVLAALGTAFPQTAPQIAALTAGGQATTGQSGDGAGAADELTLRLNVRDGRVFVGFIPLGSIPPLQLGRS